MMSNNLTLIFAGVFIVAVIYLIVIKQYNAILLILGITGVMLGFVLQSQIPEKDLLTDLRMLDNAYAQKISYTKTMSYASFFVGGLMILLGIIFIAKKRN